MKTAQQQNLPVNRKDVIGVWLVFIAVGVSAVPNPVLLLRFAKSGS